MKKVPFRMTPWRWGILRAAHVQEVQNLQRRLERDREIFDAFAKGATSIALATKYELSPEHVRKICMDLRNLIIEWEKDIEKSHLADKGRTKDTDLRDGDITLAPEPSVDQPPPRKPSKRVARRIQRAPKARTGRKIRRK